MNHIQPTDYARNNIRNLRRRERIKLLRAVVLWSAYIAVTLLLWDLFMAGLEMRGVL